MNTKTDKEKAKAYDQALKVLHKYDGVNIMFSQSLKEEMFPELAESENDRIRKAILWCIRTVELELGCKDVEGLAVAKLKSWLDRQGKNNMGISETTKQKLEDNLNKALEKETPESCNEFLDEQNLANSAKTCKDEQKPTWSKEDEIALGDALWCCKQAASIAKDENDMGNVWYAEHWLKRLKDRVQPQTKQEWSEEDENTVASIISSLSNPQLYPPTIHDIEWLKSLLLRSIGNRVKSRLCTLARQ